MNRKQTEADLKKLELERLKQTRALLLDLSRNITSVREKNDLLPVFNSHLKGRYYFTHSVVVLIHPKRPTYFAFLLNEESAPIRKHPKFNQLYGTEYPLDNPFINTILSSDTPHCFSIDDLLKRPDIPVFVNANAEVGLKEMLTVRLMKEGKPIGFIIVFSDRVGNFSDEFKEVMESIAPMLASALANILKNDAILRKNLEKSFFLELSNAIASVRTKEELNDIIKKYLAHLELSSNYIIYRFDEALQNYASYIYFLKRNQKLIKGAVPKNEKVPNLVVDGFLKRVLMGGEPELIDLQKESQKGSLPDYLHLWQSLNCKEVVVIALRSGDKNIGFLFLSTPSIQLNMLKGMAAQIAIAMANILANELLIKKNEEQQFLLAFSREVTIARNKDDLRKAIFKVLEKVMNTKLSLMRLIAKNGVDMPVYLYDETLFDDPKAKVLLPQMLEDKVTINHEYIEMVFASKEGMVFSVDEAYEKGSVYGKMGKLIRLKNMYGLPMRVEGKIIGAIWFYGNRLSSELLKGLCAQISIAVANIISGEELNNYKKRLEVENDYLKEQIKSAYSFSEIIGESTAMKEVYRLMSLVAGSDSTVMILGETGTGKELIARAIHGTSAAKNKLMVKVNCAALPANLIESELFGHEKGAFTGAMDKRIGKFEIAHNSTLFLDEIGELPLESQAKLLRVIQEQELERIGGKYPIKINVRLIVATNRDLEKEVLAGRFRADLYFRLNVFPVKLPPLRERHGDIETLTYYFVEKYARVTGKKIRKVAAKVINQLRSYSWPGNVRELEHLIERSVLLTEGDVLEEVNLSKYSNNTGTGETVFMEKSLKEVEKTYIIETLKRCNGKISGLGGACEILRIPGNTLHSKIKKLGIQKSDYIE